MQRFRATSFLREQRFWHLFLCAPSWRFRDYITPTGAADNTSARPIRWMSPEAIRSGVFNSASDVVSRENERFFPKAKNFVLQFSFGVFIFELFTVQLGQMPYHELSDEELPAALEAGTRLGQPYNCPDDL